MVRTPFKNRTDGWVSQEVVNKYPVIILVTEGED